MSGRADSAPAPGPAVQEPGIRLHEIAKSGPGNLLCKFDNLEFSTRRGLPFGNTDETEVWRDGNSVVADSPKLLRLPFR